MLSRSICLVALLAVVGCNSGVTAPKPPVLQLPVAAAGLDQSAEQGSIVVLDGSGSTDPQGGHLTYRWVLDKKPEGSTAMLSEPLAAATDFFADMTGVYVARLTVSNGQTWSNPDSVTITVQNLPPDPNNKPPVAVARVVGTPRGKEPITLDGSGSSDPEGSTLTYNWSFVSRPAGSKAELGNRTAAQSIFVPDMDGDYAVRLVVRDDRQSSQPSVASLTIDSIALADKLKDVTQRMNPSRTGSIDGGSLKFPLRRRWIHRLPPDSPDQRSSSTRQMLMTLDTIFLATGNFDTNNELHALDLATGMPSWQLQDTSWDESEGKNINLAISDQTLIYLHYDSTDGAIAAVNARTGVKNWKVTYGSALLPKEEERRVTHWTYSPVAKNGKIYATYLNPSRERRLGIFSLKDGALLKSIAVPLASGRLAVGESEIYVPMPCGGMMAFSAEGEGPVWSTAQPCSPAYQFDPAYHSIAGAEVVHAWAAGVPAGQPLSNVWRYNLGGSVLGPMSTSAEIAILGRRAIVMSTIDWQYRSISLTDTVSGQVYWNTADATPYPTAPVIVNGHVVTLDEGGMLVARRMDSGERVWSDRVLVRGDISEPYMSEDNHALWTNGNELAIRLDNSIVVYETAPALPTDDSYKTKCSLPGNHFYLEGDQEKTGVNGVPLMNGNSVLREVFEKHGTNSMFTYSEDSIWSPPDPAPTRRSIMLQYRESNLKTWSFELTYPSAVEPRVASYPFGLGMPAVLQDRLPVGMKPLVPTARAALESYPQTAWTQLNVTDIEYAGSSIKRLEANFVQHSEGEAAAVRGCIRYER